MKTYSKNNFRMCSSLIFAKVASLRPATLVKRDSAKGAFCKFWEIFKNTTLEDLFRVIAFDIRMQVAVI